MPTSRPQELTPFTIDVPLFAGQNSSADPRVVAVGSSVLVENGSFYTNGQLQKRFGLQSLPNHNATGPAIQHGAQVLSAGKALFLHDGNNLYIYNSVNKNWVLLGAVNLASLGSVVLAQSTSDVQQITSAATNDAVVIAWIENTNLYYSVYLPVNGTFLVAAKLLARTVTKPKVVTSKYGDFYIAWVDETVANVKLVRIAASNLSVIANAVDEAASQTTSNVPLHPLNDGLNYDMVICPSPSGQTVVGLAARLRGAPYSGVINYFASNQATGGDTLTNLSGFVGCAANSYNNVTATGITITASTTVAWQGSYSVKSVCVPGSGVFPCLRSSAVALTASTQYTFSCYMNGVYSLSYDVRDQNNVSLLDASQTNHWVSNTAGTWTRQSIHFTTLSTTTSIQTFVQEFADNGYTWYSDGFMINTGATAATWVDSASAGITPSVNFTFYSTNPSTPLALASSQIVTHANWSAQDTSIWLICDLAGNFCGGDSNAWIPANSGYSVPIVFPSTTNFQPGCIGRITGSGPIAPDPHLGLLTSWAEVAPVNATGTNNQAYLAQCTLNILNGTFTDTGITFRTNPNCYLASKMFAADNTYYVWALCDYALQTQLVMVDLQGRTVGRALTNGSSAPNDGVLSSLPYVAPTVDDDGATHYYFAARRRAQLQFDAAGNVSTTIGGALLDLRYAHAATQTVSVGNSIFFGGVAPKLYDGRALTEIGFYFYPGTPTLTNTANGGLLSAGSYLYAICYAWYDNQGKIWRAPLILIANSDTSQPSGSCGASITCNAGDSVTISNITYLQGSAKQNVIIEIYRTAADLSELIKVGAIPNVDQLGHLTTSYTDIVADTALAGEVAYTDGSVAPYLAPPAISYLTATPNRVYALVTESDEVWATNQTSTTIAAQFALGQTFDVPTLTAQPNAIAVMDGYLYTTTEDTLLVTAADTGTLSSAEVLQFNPPVALPIDSGCISPGSVLSTELGIWYQSAKGIMLLSRQQTTSFVGEPVKNYTSDALVLQTVVCAAQQKIRFVLPTCVLVYDYVWQRWSVDTGYDAVSACNWNGSFVLLTVDGIVRQEVPGTFMDDNNYYSRTVVTPWIQPAGISGYARCRRFIVLGEMRSPHTLQVQIAYQYDEAWVDTMTVQGSAVTDMNGIYGVNLGTYGKTVNKVFGAPGAGGVYQFEGIVPRQKATSYKFALTDIEQSGSGEASRLTMLSLECGAYLSTARIPSNKGFA